MCFTYVPTVRLRLRLFKMAMQVTTLFSGSKGNCVYIRNGNTKILIDAGRSLSALSKALLLVGGRIEDIDAVIVTHEHSDHVSALPVMMKKYNTEVHMTEKTYEAFIQYYHPSYDTVVPHETEYSINIGSLNITSFSTPHDSADSVGYVIKSDTEALGYATDMGFPTKQVFDRLCSCNRVIVESNYDEKMLREGPYPIYLKERIESNRGHLSNEGCALLVSRLAKAGVRGFVLAHLSETNNLPELALRASCHALSEIGATDVSIIVADRYCPTDIC